MDSINSAILSLGIVVLFGGVLWKRKKCARAIRKSWVNPYLRERASKGRFVKDVI